MVEGEIVMILLRMLLCAVVLGCISGCAEPTVQNNVQMNVIAPPVVQQKPQAPKQSVAVQVLSIIRVTDGLGCPKRDPNSFGVFLKSEQQGAVLICYYD